MADGDQGKNRRYRCRWSSLEEALSVEILNSTTHRARSCTLQREGADTGEECKELDDSAHFYHDPARPIYHNDHARLCLLQMARYSQRGPFIRTWRVVLGVRKENGPRILDVLSTTANGEKEKREECERRR